MLTVIQTIEKKARYLNTYANAFLGLNSNFDDMVLFLEVCFFPPGEIPWDQDRRLLVVNSLKMHFLGLRILVPMTPMECFQFWVQRSHSWTCHSTRIYKWARAHHSLVIIGSWGSFHLLRFRSCCSSLPQLIYIGVHQPWSTCLSLRLLGPRT